MTGMNGAGKKITAVMLAALLAVPAVPYSVLAADDVTEPVSVVDESAEYGNVNVESGDAAVMVTSMYDDAEVTTGDVSNSEGYGVVAISMGGEAKVNTGSITAEKSDGLDTALMSFGDDENLVTANVEGNISAGERGISVLSLGGVTDISVKGDVQSGADGVQIQATLEAVNGVIIDGSVSAADTGIWSLAGAGSENCMVVMEGVTSADTGIFASVLTQGSNSVAVGGNVTAENLGIDLGLADGGENNIIVEGTVKGGKIGVAYSDNDENDHSGAQVTVWKIEKNENGAVAGKNMEDGGFEQDESFEANNIQYIIKLEQPACGAVLAATGADGSELATIEGVSGTLHTALEGDKVLLKVDVQDGYSLTGVYGDEGRTLALLQDAEGNYYIEVPKGGGVYLSVTLDETEKPAAGQKKNDENTTSDAAPTGESFESFNAALVQMISSAAQGANVRVMTVSWPGISKEVVDALALRMDVSLTICFEMNGVMFEVTIPAGTKLDELKNASGGIDFAVLAAHFGARPL